MQMERMYKDGESHGDGGGGGLEIALCMRRQVHPVITPINRINLAAHAGVTFISDTCSLRKRLCAGVI